MHAPQLAAPSTRRRLTACKYTTARTGRQSSADQNCPVCLPDEIAEGHCKTTATTPNPLLSLTLAAQNVKIVTIRPSGLERGVSMSEHDTAPGAPERNPDASLTGTAKRRYVQGMFSRIAGH